MIEVGTEDTKGGRTNELWAMLGALETLMKGLMQ